MNEAKKSPKAAFIVAGILFLINGIISVLPSTASLFSMLTSIFNGYVGIFLSLLYNGMSILSALSVCALGVVLLINRKNTKSVVIAAGVTFGLGVLSFFLNLISGFDLYVLFSYESHVILHLICEIINVSVGVTGLLTTLLLFLLAIFNLRGNQKLCKLWFIPVIVKVITSILSIVYDFVYYWYLELTFGSSYDFAEIIIKALKSVILEGFGNLLGLLSLGFLCFALRRVVTEEPEKIEESSETEAITEPIPSPENEI